MWKQLIEETKKPYFIQMMEKIHQRMKETTVYPKEEDWFYAFDMTPFESVKVVILGQDPYHQKNQAHGLAFSSLDIKTPKSLYNIFKELSTDIGAKIPSHNRLNGWAKQGVLLLNTILTVEEDKPLSHQGIGWEEWTQAVLQLLNTKDHLVFVLWGAHAQSYASFISSRHTIIKAPHPSPLSAHRGFFGSKPFSKINQDLMFHHQTPIIWEIDTLEDRI